MVTRHARHIRATLKALSKVFVNIIQLLSLCEDKMAICSPEDNIFFYYTDCLKQVAQRATIAHLRAIINQ